MEYPLIDTGMGDMPTAVPSVIPQVSGNPAEQFDAEAYKLLEGMNPVVLGHAENVADAANNTIRTTDLIRSATQGIRPIERITELQAAKAEMELKRAGMTQKEADPTAMNNAFENVLGIMGSSPTAPQMQRPKLSDNEQLASLIAGAMGGGWEGAGQALGSAYQGAGIRANRENQIAQANFEAENNQWLNKLRVAQQQANNQSNLFNQAENRNQRNFSNELRLQDGRIAKTQQDIEDLGKEIQGFVDDTQKSISEYTRLAGEMTDKDMNHLMDMIDNQEKVHGLPKGYIADRMTIAPVGWKSATVKNQEAIAADKAAKAKEASVAQSWKNAKALFDMRLKQANMMGKVTEADRKALLPLAQELFPDSPESLLPQIGEDWRMIQGQQRLTETNRSNTAREATATARENRLGSGGGSGGGSGSGGGAPKGAKTDKQYRKEYEDLGRDINALNAKIKNTTDVEKLQEMSATMAGLVSKYTDIENLIQWTDEELKAQGAINNEFNTTLGSMIEPFKPFMENPNPNPSGLKGAVGGNPPKANTGGGKPKPTQKTAKDTKPAKSAQNAGKGQSGDTKKKANGITFNPNPR